MIWHAEREELVGAASLPAAAPPLSPVDRLASPRGFVAQLLVYNCDLDAADLRAALARVVELMPELACRAVADEVRRCRWRGARAFRGASGAAAGGAVWSSWDARASIWSSTAQA